MKDSIPSLSRALTPIIQENVAKEAFVMTDDAGQYRLLHLHFTAHGFTRHTKGNYVSRENPIIHTNSVVGYFSIFKRGMKGLTSIAPRSTCTAIWQSSISVTPIASRSAITTLTVAMPY